MTSDAERLANFRRTATVLSLTALHLQEFSSRLIARARSGQSLTPEAISTIQKGILLSLKNTETVGLDIETETKALGEAIQLLGDMIDGAVRDSGQIYKVEAPIIVKDESASGVVDDDRVQSGFLKPDLSAALDAFIALQPDPKPSRPEAIRTLLRDGLVGLGLLRFGEDPEGAN